MGGRIKLGQGACFENIPFVSGTLKKCGSFIVLCYPLDTGCKLNVFERSIYVLFSSCNYDTLYVDLKFFKPELVGKLFLLKYPIVLSTFGK